MINQAKRAAAVALMAVACLVCACQTLPLATSVRIREVVELEDGSRARAAMNARVHDAVIRTVTRNFYDRSFKGVDFAAEAAARREATIAQPDEDGFYAALNETLGLLNDSHTVATPPTVWLEMSRRALGSSPGFGMSVAAATESATGERRYFVTRMRKGGAADEAGVQPGWRVLTIDGEPWDAPWEEGRPFEGLTFVIRFEDPEGGLHDVPLESRLMPRLVGVAERRPDGVLVLRFTAFDEATADWVEARLVEALADRPRAILLDVRANGGGQLLAGGRILGGFLGEGLVFAHYRGTSGPVAYQTRRIGAVWDGPMAVLQSESSGSMAEVLAATVQEQRRGIVVGQKSAGAVVGAYTYYTPDGGFLSVGATELRTGKGQTLEQIGVQPDILSEHAYDQLRIGRDAMVETAVAALLAQPAR